MANKIILKKSSVAAKAPVAGDLDFGELAINYTDSKLYFKKTDGSIDAFTTAAASAPVTSVGGNIGAVTDSQLLASIKNVDGTGSGLDADFLDGLHASSFYLASNPNGYTSNTGTVTSVGATAPLVSSGGNTPSISIPAATSSVNGYMSSAYAAKLDGIAAGATNVTNNNQLTNGAGYTTNTGTVTSVSGTGSVSGLSLSGTVTTSGSLTLSGTLSASIDNITDEARLFNNMGQNHSTQTDFNAISDFGARFVQGGTNGPTGVGANQFYGFTLGLGNEYALGSYASQFYWPRAAQNTDTYIYVRDREGSTWGSWRKTKAGYADSAGSTDYNSLTNKTGGTGTYTTSGDYRAPIFYDSQNTAYFTDPAGRSRQSQIDFGDGGYYIHGGSWGMRNTTPYGYIEFGPANSGHAHIYTDRSNFYFNAQVQVLGGSQINQSDIRANIFYDQQDTGYYIDPNSTSDSALRMRGGALFGPNTTWGASLYVGGNGRVGTSASVAVTNGNLHIDSQNGYELYLNWYNTANIYTQSNLGLGSSSASYRLHVHGTGYATSDFRAPIFYDANDTAYYIDGNSTSSLYRVNINNNILFTNYGRGMIGTYSSTVYQAVFAMGDSYKLPDDGSTTGSLYGLAWSHPNAGGTAGNLNTHGLLVLENGGFLAAVSGSIRSRDDMRSPIFYDSNNTAYYCDPNGNSRFARTDSDEIYNYGWFRNHESGEGMYNQATGQHWYSDSGSYWNMGYAGGGQGIRFRDGHGGTVRGYIYYDTGNDIGFLNQDGNWRLRVVSGDYTLSDGSSMRAQMYYDSNDTNKYLDLNGTSRFAGLQYFIANRNTSSDSPALQAYSDNGSGAIMSFHRGGYYAVNFGLDSDNVMRIGGWSASVNRWQLDMSGNGTYAGNVTAYSDERLKTDWESLAFDFVENLAKVKSGTYTRIDSGERQAGSSAQDWQKLLPEVVTAGNDDDKTLALAYGNAALVSAIELAKRVVEQDARIAKLEERLSKLLDD